MNKKSVLDYNYKGKRVVVRCDFNVPVEEGKITDLTRIRESIKTIEYIKYAGGKLILISHFGRPNGIPDSDFSLRTVATFLKDYFGDCFKFIDDNRVYSERVAKEVSEMKPGDICLLENTRFRKEEKENDENFSKELASLGDIYINDAFGSSHRAHASTAGIPKFLPSGTGFLLKKELDVLGEAVSKPEKPFTAILGGSKVSDKILVIKNLLNHVDNLIIGGGMAFTFLKAQGYSIGKSLLEEEKVLLAKELLEDGRKKGVNIYLPVDVIVSDEFSNEGNIERVLVDSIPDDMIGLDVGEKSNKIFEKVIYESKTIVWNGPMGVFEMAKFARGTYSIAEAMAKTEGLSIVGGGDSAAAVIKSGFASNMDHISTGGGASLELLEGKELPGVAAIKDKLRTPIICGNWKMNTTISGGLDIVREIYNKMKDDDCEIAIFPPFTHLYPLRRNGVNIGAQNINDHIKGAFTGEVSVEAIYELGVNYTIVGHSERRMHFGEDDDLIMRKVRLLLKNTISPIICCGEPLEVREKGDEKEYVKKQIVKAYENVSFGISKNTVVAYEPIWAIGTGKTATPEQAQEMCSFIRVLLSELGLDSDHIRILYGGSVTDKNAVEILGKKDIDGALVGGASLKYKSFLNIVESTRVKK